MPALPLVGDELAGYRLRAVLGRGGMSVVFQAENPRIGSLVALKVLAPEISTDDVFRARFLQESRIAASLNHPNVIPIFDMGSHDDLLYIAMRYVSGSDLRSIIKSRHHLEPAEAVLLVHQAARALDYAHRHGLVHRDVKPANLLVQRGIDDDPDHVYLADFGITKHALSRTGLTPTGQFLGTLDYVAPEQIQGREVDSRADLYSLGCVLYECLTGRVPFVKEADAAVIWAHVEEPPTRPSELRPELGTGIDDVIARALAKEPDDRYDTCRELVDAARSVLSDTHRSPETVLGPAGGSPPPPYREGQGSHDPYRNSGPRTPVPPVVSPPPPPPPGSDGEPRTPGGRRRGLLIAAGLAVLLVVASGAAWLGLRGDDPPADVVDDCGALVSAQVDNPLLAALNHADDGKANCGNIDLSTCTAESDTLVNCTAPAPGVISVRFETFADIHALYEAYMSTVGEVSGMPFDENGGTRCYKDKLTMGEVSWNHSFIHSQDYPVAMHEAGDLPAGAADGRLFCALEGDTTHLVWTDDAGFMLATLVGRSHEVAYPWWVKVHHLISFADMAGEDHGMEHM